MWVASGTVPKDGSCASQNDDALAQSPQPLPSGRLTADGYTVAVSDGATESYLSGAWARRLVEIAVATEGPVGIGELLAVARADWADQVARYAVDRASSGRPLAWFEEAKLDQGAAATLAIVRLSESRRRRLDRFVPRSRRSRALTANITIVGDCVVALVHDDDLECWPTKDPAWFGNTPELLRSVGEPLVPAAVEVEVEVSSGDQMIVMTDALGAWFLARAQEGGHPWEQLATVLMGGSADAELAAFVDRCRAHEGMRNDDVTVGLLSWGDEP